MLSTHQKDLVNPKKYYCTYHSALRGFGMASQAHSTRGLNKEARNYALGRTDVYYLIRQSNQTSEHRTNSGALSILGQREILFIVDSIFHVPDLLRYVL